MNSNLNKIWRIISIWTVNRYQKGINSIAFYPALIAIIFITLAFFLVAFDFSETGKNIKSRWDWLSLKDPSTARSIISAIVSGIISLTVFSFSMVMFILNQTASQMSNRILDNLIGNRFQQVVQAFYLKDSESIENNFFYGFRQLTEVAVKALSPGINDPGTAIVSLRALVKLFVFRIANFPDGAIRNQKNEIVIIKTEMSFNELFKSCIFPIWDYGKSDRMIQQELFKILSYLRTLTETTSVNKNVP